MFVSHGYSSMTDFSCEIHVRMIFVEHLSNLARVCVLYIARLLWIVESFTRNRKRARDTGGTISLFCSHWQVRSAH